MNLDHLTHDQAIRLRCIELAVEHGDPQPLETAKAFHAYLTEDAKTPRQLIDEALERAGVR